MNLLDPSPPELANYQVSKFLGSGASGDVFLAKSNVNGRQYVIKQMSLRNMTDEQKLRAQQEILVMDGVDHPNVVKFRESFASEDSVDIVMEYCECGTLAELIERQRYEGTPLSEDVLTEWMAELLCALAHIHSRRILHRDLKSDNIFVTKKNHLKLGDFGVCTVLTNVTAVTADGMIGTPYYFAPEVCNGQPYDELSDVWSLGIVFYEMCTLRRPFEANDFYTLVQRILQQDVTPFKTGLSSDFEAIVRKMLSKKPADRPTAQDLIDVHLEVPPSHPSYSSQTPSRSRLMQQYYGPELTFRKPWPPPPGVDVSERIPWLDSRDDKQQFAELRRTMHIPPQVPTAALKCDSSPPAPKVRTAVRLTATPTKPRVTLPTKMKLPAKTGTSRRRTTKGNTKNRKNATDIKDLHEDVIRRRGELFGTHSWKFDEDTPLVIELMDLRVEPGGNYTGSGSYDGSSDLTSVRATSNFLEDVAAVVKRHSVGGQRIDLEQLDDAVCLLTQYKLTNHGIH